MTTGEKGVVSMKRTTEKHRRISRILSSMGDLGEYKNKRRHRGILWNEDNGENKKRFQGTKISDNTGEYTEIGILGNTGGFRRLWTLTA